MPGPRAALPATTRSRTGLGRCAARRARDPVDRAVAGEIVARVGHRARLRAINDMRREAGQGGLGGGDHRIGERALLRSVFGRERNAFQLSPPAAVNQARASSLAISLMIPMVEWPAGAALGSALVNASTPTP